MASSSTGRKRGESSAGCGKPRPLIGSSVRAKRANSSSGTMHTLVVCGATNATEEADPAMFADFMGISQTFRAVIPDAHGTYISCFPIGDHFDFLEKSRPKKSDIKWGHFGPNQTPLFTYSKTQWTTRQGKWFEQVDPAELLGRVGQWILDKSQEASRGDVVNIFFQCHGNRAGDIVIGTKRLPVSQYVNLSKLFAPGVQVNAVGSHCRSGRLVEGVKADNQLHRYTVAACGPDELAWTTPRSVSNRCRNFRFSQPFIQSLARVKLPGVEQIEAPPITLEEHEAFMLAETRKFPLIGGQGQTYTSSIQSPQEAAMILLEDSIFRDQVDVAYERESAHRRRRAEWPTLDLPLLNNFRRQKAKITQISSETKAAAASLIEAATSKIDMNNAFRGDGSTVNFLIGMANPEEYYPAILQLLYYRARQQSACWDLFTVLCERGFLDMSISLREPIDWIGSPRSVRIVLSILSCFDAVKKEREQSKSPFYGWTQCDCVMEWFAVVIARGCADPNLLVAEIETTQMLGHFHRDLFEEWKMYEREPLSWVCDPMICAKEMSGYLGMFLPHGLGSDLSTWPDQLHKKINTFNKIESVYKEYFQIPDHELQTEAQQDGFLRKYPELEPRLKHSGHWKPEDSVVSPPLTPSSPDLQRFYHSLK